MNTNKQITGLSALVLSQVLLFVVVYVATIAVGIGLLYLVAKGSIWGVPIFFEKVAPEILRGGRFGIVALIGCVIGFIGLWTFVAAIGVYLVKPLFLRPKSSSNHGIEIHRGDAPKLFDLIEETAKEVGVRRPKHVYVNSEVNACVFFDTSFWNIIFPVRKNLAIGLGLFQSTNTQEVKGIIAHEFGHFAQGSMRVGSVLYVANKVITDLTYRRDKLDSLLLRWCLQNGVWGFWGKTTQFVVIRFRNLLDAMFRSQQRNYMKLSRQMEYDADAVACRVVGSDNFISGLCKIQLLDRNFGYYHSVLNSFGGENKIIKNYWEGYELAVAQLNPAEKRVVKFNDKLSTPDREEQSSRVSVEEIWQSHPAIEKRVAHAQGLAKPSSDKTVEPAWNIVGDLLKNSISDMLLKEPKADPNAKFISWEEFSNELKDKIAVSFYPDNIGDFLGRYIIFEERPTSTELPANPLNEENSVIIKEYEQAVIDLNTLQQIADGKYPIKRFVYNGVDYSVKDERPLEEQKQYVEELRKKVIAIDAAIKAKAIELSDAPERIKAAYDAINYAQSVLKRIDDDFLPVRGDIIKELNAANIGGEEDFDGIRGWLDSYEGALKDVLKSLKYRQITPFMSREEHEHMLSFLDASRSFAMGINSDAINHMFNVTDWILRVHQRLDHQAKMVVAYTLAGGELPNTDFLNLWKTDSSESNVSSENNDSQMSKDDEHEYVTVNSVIGSNDIKVPTDEEIDVIYYQEHFRTRLWDAWKRLPSGEPLVFGTVATSIFKEEDGNILPPDDSEEAKKFFAEYKEFSHFIRDTKEYDWSAISDSADKGDPEALALMAKLYLSQDRYSLAHETASKSAVQNCPAGLSLLGVIALYYTNPRESKQAFTFFKCAAESGDKEALCQLGLMYLNGEYIEKDEDRAISLLERAALQGDPIAQENLGQIFLRRPDLEEHEEKGLYMLYEAANQGRADAVNALWQYYKAVGDSENYTRIVKFGAEHNIQECKEELDMITMFGATSPNPILNYGSVVNNPVPVYDITSSGEVCPVCGGAITPQTTVCPHCKETIWENPDENSN